MRGLEITTRTYSNNCLSSSNPSPSIWYTRKPGIGMEEWLACRLTANGRVRKRTQGLYHCAIISLMDHIISDFQNFRRSHHGFWCLNSLHTIPDNRLLILNLNGSDEKESWPSKADHCISKRSSHGYNVFNIKPKFIFL